MQTDQAAPAIDNAPPTNIPKEVWRLRVWRCEVNELAIVRLLSDDYGGMMTHYYRGHSQYCAGEKCNPLMHKSQITWKGYCAAEMYIEPTGKKKGVWRPICLELTEHCELDMRGKFARGQLWQISRPHEPDKRNPPIYAALLEERDPAAMPKAFDYKPVLQTMYHTIHLDLTVKNPLPPRVFVYDSEGDAPEVLKSKLAYEEQDREYTEEMARAAQERGRRAAEAMRQKKKPV